jgi:digeranylgeranylglycerophospholipid reductase
VSRHALEEVGIVPDDEFIQEPIYGFEIYDESGASTAIDYRQLKGDEYGQGPGLRPLGYVVDRRRFDRHLMTLAIRAGAEAWLKTEGLGYTCDDDGLATVHLRRYGEEVAVRCRCVVGADGLMSQVGKWAGLRTHIRIGELAACLQYVCEGVESKGLLEIITGHEWAPGGYAWVFPKGHGYTEIGLGVTPNHTRLSAKQHLQHFMEHSFLSDRFAKAKILEVQGGGVPLAAPLTTQFADRMILVGDAARHVNPITGGGIHTALSGGLIAAEVLAKAVKEDRIFSPEVTETYQEAWLEKLGEKMWKLYREKSSIFREEALPRRNERLYRTMSSYFSPDSEYKKI